MPLTVWQSNNLENTLEIWYFDFLVINFTKSMSIAHSLETDACKRFNGVHFNHLNTTVEEKLLLQTLT